MLSNQREINMYFYSCQKFSDLFQGSDNDDTTHSNIDKFALLQMNQHSLYKATTEQIWLTL